MTSPARTPNQRAKAAMEAMEDFGFKKTVAKQALRTLLQENDNNWDYVETSNYSVLVQCIFDLLDAPPQAAAASAAAAAVTSPTTRSKTKRRNDQASPSVKKRKTEAETPAVIVTADSGESDEVPLQRYRRTKRTPTPTQTPEVKDEPAAEARGDGAVKVERYRKSSPRFEMPLAVIHPTEKGKNCEDGSLVTNADICVMDMPQTTVEQKASNGTARELAKVDEAVGNADLEVASSGSGEVKLMLSFPNSPGFRMLNMDELFKEVEDRCLRSYKILDPGFSIANLMKQMCECALELGSEPNGEKGENVENAVPQLDSLKKPGLHNFYGSSDGSLNMELSGDSGANKKAWVMVNEFGGPEVVNTDGVMVNESGGLEVVNTDEIMVNEFGGPEVLNTENASSEDASLEDANEDQEAVNLDGEDMNTATECTDAANLIAENIITGNLDADSITAANLVAENINIINPDAEEIRATSLVAESNNTANLVAENFNTANFDSANSLVVVHPPQLALVRVRPSHDVSDISRGKERSTIPVVNELNDGRLPAPFYYIKLNNLYQSAKVNFSFAQIGDGDCCMDCFGDCLAAPVPCFCKEKTDGGFAYTKNGLIKAEFLDQSISMKQNPENHNSFFCERCPFEKIKDSVVPGPCKGHLIRKFVKECWNKCGCSKKCGNRVVQRGIVHNLQVFFTGEAKGWGVRTLDPLPRGSFVCEYVGEIVTSVELYDRTLRTKSSARDTHPILLDAGWESKGTLEDGEVLCLDASIHGNVARFVNHQCHDANLIEIPVEVETPDRHYYRLALFTTRKVEAFEELTWDYGISFDDNNQPMRTFQCHCESRYCRDVNHTMHESSLVSDEGLLTAVIFLKADKEIEF